MAPTPAEGSDGELDGETQSDGDEQPADSHGAYLPKKPTPRNGDPPQNRFAVEPHFTFEDDEIGVREHHLKRNNKNELSYSGMDPHPNPKKFHFDQVARGLNSAKNKPEDLDEDLVAEFRVHPQYGLAVKDSVNPDWSDESSFEPTDWSKPLAETESIVFIEDGPHNLELDEQDKPAWHTSRSNWVLKTNRAWEETTTGDRVPKAVEATVAREKAGIKNKHRELDPDLTAAANKGLAEFNANEKESRRSRGIQQESGKAKKSRAVWPPRPGPTTPQRSLPYDPTKDTGNGNTSYQTPYPTGQSQAPMGQNHPREDSTRLEALAHIAGSQQPSQPQAYSSSRWVEPPHMNIREEDGNFNGMSPRQTGYMTGNERNRSRPHQFSNSNFTPQPYSPQSSARQQNASRFPQQYSPPVPAAAFPPQRRSLQSPSHQTTYQSSYQLPPQQPQLSPQRPQPQAQAPAGTFRTLAPAPPQGGSGPWPGYQGR